MKKNIFISALALITMSALVGCNQAKQPVTTPSTQTTPAIETQPTAQNDILGIISGTYGDMMVIGKDHVAKPMDSDITMANGTKVTTKGKLIIPATNMPSKESEEYYLRGQSTEENSLGTDEIIAMDGTILLTGGSVLLPNGVIVFSHGGIDLKDGTSVDESSVHLVDPNQTFIGADGYTFGKDDKFSYVKDAPDQKMTFEDGTVVTSDGTATKVTFKDGTVALFPENTITLADGTTLSSKEGAKITRPDGTTINTAENAVMTLKDGTVISVANTIIKEEE